MRILKSTLATAITFVLLSSGLFAGTTLPLEVCVVNHDKFSEHHKGPIDVTYNGRTIQVCCGGCVRKFKKDPEKFIKAWDEALKKQGPTPVATTAANAPAKTAQ